MLNFTQFRVTHESNIYCGSHDSVLMCPCFCQAKTARRRTGTQLRRPQEQVRPMEGGRGDAGELSISQRKDAAARSGFKQSLIVDTASGFKCELLLEGENHLNMMVGVAHEPEEYFEGDEMHAGVSCYVDGPNCILLRKSKTTTVKLVRAGSSKEEGEDVPRNHARVLSVEDKFYVHFPKPNNPLCFAFKEDYEMMYKRTETGVIAKD